MTGTAIFALAAIMICIAFLFGIFGMAGGLILIGILLAFLPLPEAMALHAIAQMASNGWRGLLWIKYVRWLAAAYFLSGTAAAFLFWTLVHFVPAKAIAFILLGLSPLLVRFISAGIRPNPEQLGYGLAYGSSCMMLLTGITGPLIDQYFLSGRYGRREIVATKAVCQVIGHGAKFIYFGEFIERTSSVKMPMIILAIGASIMGTSLARPLLERLSDLQFRQWSAAIITVIAIAYLAQGGYLLFQ